MYFFILNFSPQTWQFYPYMCANECVKKKFKHGPVQCVVNISRKTRESQDTSTKHTVKDIKIHGICYEIVPMNIMGFSNHAQRFPGPKFWMNPLQNLNCFKKVFLG